MSSQDLSLLLEDWPYEPDRVSVRKFLGVDGRLKLQMRIDLGLVQMEYEGRPDSRRPYEFDSALDYQTQRLSEFQKANGTTFGFSLSAIDCSELLDEGAMFFQRCLCLFVLDDYDQIIRDNAHHYSVAILCERFGESEQDRKSALGSIPYLISMRTRAQSLRSAENAQLPAALKFVHDGIVELRRHYLNHQGIAAYLQSSEIGTLRKLAADLDAEIQADPKARLQRQLANAIDEERYEDAADIRDRISKHAGP